MFKYFSSIDEITDTLCGLGECVYAEIMPIIYNSPKTKSIISRKPTFEEVQEKGVAIICYTSANRDCPFTVHMTDDFFAGKLTEALHHKMIKKHGKAYLNDMQKAFNQKMEEYKKLLHEDEADKDLEIKKRGFIFVKNTDEIYRIVKIAFSHYPLSYKVHVPRDVDLSNNSIDVKVTDALGVKHPYTIYNDFEASNAVLTHDMRYLLAKDNGNRYLHLLRKYEPDEKVVENLIKELNGNSEAE